MALVSVAAVEFGSFTAWGLSLNRLSALTETESENEFRPLDGRIDEFHPKATRTLFIGNLEKTTNYQQLLDVFQRFGEIVVRYLLTPHGSHTLPPISHQ